MKGFQKPNGKFEIKGVYKWMVPVPENYFFFELFFQVMFDIFDRISHKWVVLCNVGEHSNSQNFKEIRENGLEGIRFVRKGGGIHLIIHSLIN